MTRAADYAAWIDAYIDQGNVIVGHCRNVCEAMLAEFPELELRGGFVRTRLGNDLHYWLRAPSGEIVDPTEAQFGRLRPDDYDDAGTTDTMTLLRRVLIFTDGP